MRPDIGNAVFEFGGFVMMIKAVWRLVIDKKIRGVWWPAWMFYAGWGLWNLWYYPTLSQWWSFTAGVLLVGSNIVWCCLAFRYRKN